jgi:Protein of unknown function (DUF3592)
VPSLDRDFFIIAGSIIVLFFLGLAYVMSIVHLVKSWMSKSWPKTKGVVKESKIHERTDSDGTTYQAKAIYAYSVAGKEFESDNIAFCGMLSLAQNVAIRYYSRLIPNSEVDVYYNPSKPSEATLYVGIYKDHIYSIIYVAAITAYFVYAFIQNRV